MRVRAVLTCLSVAIATISGVACEDGGGKHPPVAVDASTDASPDATGTGNNDAAVSADSMMMQEDASSDATAEAGGDASSTDAGEAGSVGDAGEGGLVGDAGEAGAVEDGGDAG